MPIAGFGFEDGDEPPVGGGGGVNLLVNVQVTSSPAATSNRARSSPAANAPCQAAPLAENSRFVAPGHAIPVTAQFAGSGPTSRTSFCPNDPAGYANVSEPLAPSALSPSVSSLYAACPVVEKLNWVP